MTAAPFLLAFGSRADNEMLMMRMKSKDEEAEWI